MKTLCTTVAWVSGLGFFYLMVAALFQFFYIRPHVSIPLAIPTIGESAYKDTRQLDCMAQNIYFEAQGESAKGKMMVGMVVIQRTLSPHFPDTICGVVFQANKDASGNIIKYQCSFSWVCDGKDHSLNLNNPIDRREWMQSYSIAKMIIDGKLKSKIDMEGVTHYHANYVRPNWSRNKNYTVVARVGDHIFYRWKKATLPKYNVAAL